MCSLYPPQANLIQEIPVYPGRIRDYYIEYGPSARTCYWACMSEEDWKMNKTIITASIENMTLDDLGKVLGSQDLTPTHSNQESAASHFVVVIEPADEKRLNAKANIITRSVMRRLWKAQQVHLKLQGKALFALLSRHPASSPTAGWFYEGFIHNLLEDGTGIDQPLHLFREDLNPASNAKYDTYVWKEQAPEGKWTSSTMTYVPFSEANNELDLQPDHYYVPINSHFPTLDSFTFQHIHASECQYPILDTVGNILSKVRVELLSLVIVLDAIL